MAGAWRRGACLRRVLRRGRVWRGAVYDIYVQNPDAVEKGVRSIRVDGKETDIIPVLPVGGSCRVDIIMG